MWLEKYDFEPPKQFNAIETNSGRNRLTMNIDIWETQLLVSAIIFLIFIQESTRKDLGKNSYIYTLDLCFVTHFWVSSLLE